MRFCELTFTFIKERYILEYNKTKRNNQSLEILDKSRTNSVLSGEHRITSN